MAAAVASGDPREFVSVQLLEPNTEHPLYHFYLSSGGGEFVRTDGTTMDKGTKNMFIPYFGIHRQTEAAEGEMDEGYIYKAGSLVGAEGACGKDLYDFILNKLIPTAENRLTAENTLLQYIAKVEAEGFRPADTASETEDEEDVERLLKLLYLTFSTKTEMYISCMLHQEANEEKEGVLEDSFWNSKLGNEICTLLGQEYHGSLRVSEPLDMPTNLSDAKSRYQNCTRRTEGKRTPVYYIRLLERGRQYIEIMKKKKERAVRAARAAAAEAGEKKVEKSEELRANVERREKSKKNVELKNVELITEYSD